MRSEGDVIVVFVVVAARRRKEEGKAAPGEGWDRAATKRRSAPR